MGHNRKIFSQGEQSAMEINLPREGVDSQTWDTSEVQNLTEVPCLQQPWRSPWRASGGSGGCLDFPGWELRKISQQFVFVIKEVDGESFLAAGHELWARKRLGLNLSPFLLRPLLLVS